MISKNKQKLIRSLERKKVRTETGLFVAEGPKLVGELLCAGWHPAYVAATAEWWEGNCKMVKEDVEQDVISYDELERVSLLRTPQQVVCLFRIPSHEASLSKVAEEELCLALDGVQDPGNLGTIVRLADWFGIHHVFCSEETADIYGPKAIQATMGAISRVHVHYINIVKGLAECQAPIYGTHLDGENIYQKALTQNGVIVMGNEGNGISQEVGALVNERLFIPPYPANRTTVESLNVAIATAIVCAEFRRK